MRAAVLNRQRSKNRALDCGKLVLGLTVGSVYYVLYVMHVELYGTASGTVRGRKKAKVVKVESVCIRGILIYNK